MAMKIQIIALIKWLLLAGLSRSHQLSRLPGWKIYGLRRSIESKTQTGRSLRRMRYLSISFFF
jgi:hypothetical protein